MAPSHRLFVWNQAKRFKDLKGQEIRCPRVAGSWRSRRLQSVEGPGFESRCCLLITGLLCHRCAVTFLKWRANWCSNCSLALRRHYFTVRPSRLGEWLTLRYFIQNKFWAKHFLETSLQAEIHVTLSVSNWWHHKLTYLHTRILSLQSRCVLLQVKCLWEILSCQWMV